MKSSVLLRLATVLLVSIPVLVIASPSPYKDPAHEESGEQSLSASGGNRLHLMGSLESLESIAVVSRVDGVVESYAHDVGEKTVGSKPLVNLNHSCYALCIDRISWNDDLSAER